MKKPLGTRLEEQGWPVEELISAMKEDITNEDEHLLSHGYLVSLSAEYEDVLYDHKTHIEDLKDHVKDLDDKIEDLNDKVEALEKKAFIAIAIIGITTITIALAKDKITEKVNSFKEKRKAKTK